MQFKIVVEKNERRAVVEVGHNKMLKKSDTEIKGILEEASWKSIWFVVDLFA